MNKNESLYYAANLLYQARCDWSDSKQVRAWLQEAKGYLPEELAEYIDEEYIEYACEDGRHCRDSFPNYNDIWSMVDLEDLSYEFKGQIADEFEFYLSFSE